MENYSWWMWNTSSNVPCSSFSIAMFVYRNVNLLHFSTGHHKLPHRRLKSPGQPATPKKWQVKTLKWWNVPFLFEKKHKKNWRRNGFLIQTSHQQQPTKKSDTNSQTFLFFWVKKLEGLFSRYPPEPLGWRSTSGPCGWLDEKLSKKSMKRSDGLMELPPPKNKEHFIWYTPEI